MNYNNEYIAYMEQYRRIVGATVAAEVRRRRIAIAMTLFLKKKKICEKKKFCVTPIFENQNKYSFFFTSFPKLILRDIRFHNYFRMTPTQLEELLNLIGPKLQKQDVVRQSIKPPERLALTLRYLASGDSMISISYQYLVGETTASNIIRDTCEVIWESLCPLFLPGKLEERDWLDIANDYNEKWNFPHCIGSIDGKHVTIQCPNKPGSSFYNYEHSHSIVLMAICDADYVIRFVDIGAYGRRSDGGIFKDSAIGEAFDKGRMNIPQPAAIGEGGPILPYCLVGDEAFPLKPYLLRPYPGRGGLTPEQDVYNYRLSRARRIIENTFGILASEWRIYRKPIIASANNAKLMVQATICLHNWLRRQDINVNKYVSPSLVDIDNPDCLNGFKPGSWRTITENGCTFQDISRCGSNMSAKQCVEIRNEFCRYFNNEGAVPWQNTRTK